MNPWEEIGLDDYEKHMSLDRVYQLQALNQMMKEQLYCDNFKFVMILGIAGGNGLNHIKPEKINTVYGVDVNANYLEQCTIRFPELKNCLKTICTDLTEDNLQLPHADLLVANLLIEYIGYAQFQRVVLKVEAAVVSCIIQINTDEAFVSNSPYTHVFDRLEGIHHQIEGEELKRSMGDIGYQEKMKTEQMLPNGKKLVRIDFVQ